MKVWARQPKEFFERATIDVDGTLVVTTGECKEGMDISYKGTWGYHPLVVSLANTGEVLRLVNRSGNRPSHEGAAEEADQAIALCRRAGFRKIVLRGDTDFSQTEQLDGWDADGRDLRLRLRGHAEPGGNRGQPAENGLEEAGAAAAVRGEDRAAAAAGERQAADRPPPRVRGAAAAGARRWPSSTISPTRVPAGVPHGRGPQEHLGREGRSSGCSTRSATSSTSPTTGRVDAEEVVFEANDRCDQENLIAQLAGGVRALVGAGGQPGEQLGVHGDGRAGLEPEGLVGVVAAGGGPLARRSIRRRSSSVLRMEFRTFLNAFIKMPCQIVRAGRQADLPGAELQPAPAGVLPALRRRCVVDGADPEAGVRMLRSAATPNRTEVQPSPDMKQTTTRRLLRRPPRRPAPLRPCRAQKSRAN